MYCMDCGADLDFQRCRCVDPLQDFFCKKLPPAGDRGQRYEVRFTDEDGNDKVLGWSETYPQNYIDAVNAHPSWHSPRVVDRRPPEKATSNPGESK